MEGRAGASHLRDNARNKASRTTGSVWRATRMAGALAVAIVGVTLTAAGHPPPPVTPREDVRLSHVLDAHVDACGGRAAFEGIETRAVAGRIVTDLPTWDPPVLEVDSVRVYSACPSSYLAIHRTSRGTDVEFFDGEEGWKVDVEGKAFDLKPSDPRSAWLTDPRFSARLEKHFPDMEYLGTTVIDGRPLHVVDVDGEHLHRLYFDVETDLLVRIGYNRRILSYRELDGVLVPCEVEHSRKGGSSTFVLDRITHNVELDEQLLSTPADDVAY